MFAASAVSFVVCWLKQGEFPLQGEDRQHIRLRCILHTREISFGPVVSFLGVFAKVGPWFPEAHGGTEAPWRPCTLSWSCPLDFLRALWTSADL